MSKLRDVGLIFLVASAILQPIQIAAFGYPQYGDGKSHLGRCKCVLFPHQIIQSLYDARGLPKIGRLLEYRINRFMMADSKYGDSICLAFPRTVFCSAFDLLGMSFIDDKKGFGLNIGTLYENNRHNMRAVFSKIVIGLGSIAFQPRQHITQLRNGVGSEAINDLIEGAATVDCSLSNIPNVEWSPSFLPYPCGGPNDIIGDVGLAASSEWRTLNRADLGICGDDAGLFGSQNDNKGICARTKEPDNKKNPTNNARVAQVEFMTIRS